MTTFSTTLKDILAARRLSQNKAAEMAEYDHSYLSRLVSGSRMPAREFIDRLADGCTLSDDEHRRLLVAAGFVPRDEGAILLDPALRDIADALHDESIPPDYRDLLRRQIVALVDNTRQMAA